MWHISIQIRRARAAAAPSALSSVAALTLASVKTLTTYDCIKFPPSTLSHCRSVAFNSGAVVEQCADSTGSSVENTHDWWWRAAGRSGPGFGLFTVQ